MISLFFTFSWIFRILNNYLTQFQNELLNEERENYSTECYRRHWNSISWEGYMLLIKRDIDSWMASMMNKIYRHENISSKSLWSKPAMIQVAVIIFPLAKSKSATVIVFWFIFVGLLMPAAFLSISVEMKSLLIF